VRKLRQGQTNSKTIIELLKQVFSEYGIPRVVRSDNGPQYDSQDFKDFAKQYNFQHITSSPHYPQSNGFIESQVKTVKKTLIKAQATQTDPHMALLCLRATPIDNKLQSPAQLLMGRTIQDNLPRKIQRDITSDDVTERLQQRQEQQKYYHNRNTKPLPTLLPRQSVTIQDPVSLRWKPAVIKEKIQEVPRSYTVTTTTTGRELRRNRVHTRETDSQPDDNTPLLNQDKQLNTPIKENQATTTRSGRVVNPPERYGFQNT